MNRGTEWYLNLRFGQEGLLLRRNDSDVEDSREDENEAGGRGGSWRGEAERAARPLETCASNPTALLPRMLTDEAEDVPDGGHQDDKQVDHEDEAKRDADVYGPAERFFREQDLQQGPANLQ